MPNFEKEQIDILVKLQEIEIETDIIKLKKINDVSIKIDALDNELKTFKETIDEEESHIKDWQQKYRSYEADAKINLAKAQKSQEKLKSVKTNKEYQSSLKEIEEIKAVNSKLEDDMLECLERMDMAEADIAKKKEEYLILTDKVKNEKDNIMQESEQGRKKISQLEKTWNTISEKLDPGLIKQFNVVKKIVNGTAIAAVIDTVCQGCNMNIPPQMYNELQRFESLKFCPHCQRIIYWEKS